MKRTQISLRLPADIVDTAQRIADKAGEGVSRTDVVEAAMRIMLAAYPVDDLAERLRPRAHALATEAQVLEEVRALRDRIDSLERRAGGTQKTGSIRLAGASDGVVGDDEIRTRRQQASFQHHAYAGFARAA